ncbi:50S ribosomal protein L25/general stress protein Ctc [Pseudactinotalea sp. Z1739]|uniref:50S ribosomal protein L25/general stress protein Ctc n=1 Tax=Pseudactinotalea sp. Z1739 TaxID=3413028 RepID=UPI003C7D7494
MSDNDKYTLEANVRTEFGKGAARRTRRAGLIPAVMYGHGSDPMHLTLPGHETFLALKDNPNALLTLVVDGESQLALSKDVQRDPVRRTIDHVDLVQVRRGEKVSVEIAVHIEGESAPDTIHTLEMQTLQVLAEATNIPEYVVANIDGLEEGHVLRAGDLPLPAGVESEEDPDTVVVLITIPRVSEEDLEADTEDAEEPALVGEPEGGADEGGESEG